MSKYACHFPNELQVSSFQMIEDSFSSGYNWCVDTIKMSSQHSQLANDLEINKAVMFLKQKDFTSAVETLKAFEKQVFKNIKFLILIMIYNLINIFCRMYRARSFVRITFFRNSSVVLSKFVSKEKLRLFEWRPTLNVCSNDVLSKFERT